MDKTQTAAIKKSISEDHEQAQRERRSMLLKEAILLYVSYFLVPVGLFILKYHRMPYGGNSIPLTWTWWDYVSLTLLGGTAIYILILKPIEYAFENNDPRKKLVRELRAENIGLDIRVKELEEGQTGIMIRIDEIEDVCPKLASSPGAAMERAMNNRGGGNCGQ